MEVEDRLHDIEVVCMDADLTLVEYKLVNLITLDYTSIARSLISMGYSSALLDSHWLENIQKYACQGLIADLKNGNILKLNEDFTISRGYYGMDRLTEEQLQNTYGSPAKFELETLEEFFQPDKWWISHTYFSVGALYCFQVAVELFKNGSLGLDDITILPGEIRKAVSMNYGTEDPYDPRSFFYPEMNSNTDKYLERRDDIKEALVRLRNRGKKLVLVTNAIEHYANLVMAKSFGEDWHALFDLIIVDAGKPNFFKLDRQFEEPNSEKSKGKYKRKGCAKLIEEELKTSKILFCGDHMLGDMFAPKHYSNWQVVGVLKELYFEKSTTTVTDKKKVPEISTALQLGPNCLDYTSVWGSFFSDEDGKLSLWWKWVSRYSDYIGSDIIELLDNII